MTTLSPIALFVYNRPTHTRQTVEALKRNVLAKDSDLIIFSDAPKNPEAESAVQAVRDYIRLIDGFKSIKIIERDKNWGLANSIVDGVTSVVNEYGRIIVLEDDLVTSTYFLSFMNEALDRYQNEPQVMQISGHMFPVQFLAETDAVFLPKPTSWGWATWKRAWQSFDSSTAGYELLKHDAKLRHRFNLDGAYDFFGMLEQQLQGKIDSWAIRWYLSVFMNHGLTLYPQRTLVENKGFDGSGTHCGIEQPVGTLHQGAKVETYPAVVINEVAKRAVYAYLAKRDSQISRLRSRVEKWFGMKVL